MALFPARPTGVALRLRKDWRPMALLALALLAAPAGAAPPAQPAPGASLQLEQLTWTELRDRIAAGSQTILLPIGGTEQSGPQLALGKHNLRVQVLAERIALALGQTLVAPVLAYVPEGSIDPPAGHMRFAGTISISEATFEALLESAARSFKQHGFRDVVLLGDHGGYQKNLQHVADKLNKEWRRGAAPPSCHVLALTDYYRASQEGHASLLAVRGFSAAEIGSHAGLADTALALATTPSMVRLDQLARAARAGEREGVQGDPRAATAALGQIGVDHIVQVSVAAIRDRIRPP